MKRLLITLFTFSFAAIINIPDDYSTIQEGISVAEEGDTVFIADGIYSPSTTGESFPIIMLSNIDLIGAGEEVTILDAEQTGQVMIMEHCENNTISDITITGGLIEFGGGIYLYLSHPTLTHMTITGNTAGYGGGMYLFNSNPTLSHINISGNLAEGNGGGMYLYLSHPTLAHMTITGNTAGYGGGMGLYFSNSTLTHVTIINNTAASSGGGINLISSGSTTLTNSIIWNNDPQSIVLHDSGLPMFNYSDIEGGWEDEGNINADPLFTDSENGNYTLQEGSPCIDAGTSDLDGDGMEDITNYYGSAPDMGAFEWMSDLLLADLNEDGSINIQDIMILIDIILENITITDDQILLADINGNSNIDIYDIILMINIILDN